jgi:glycosyltransferase involved in cell wall biosynthesis
MTPRISVVIPTYKRPQLLLRCLTTVLSQRIDADAYEVIVVDDGHDEATRKLVESLKEGAPLAAELRYLRPPTGRGPAVAVARNVGWRAARGALVAFTDDDTVPARDWLAEGERVMQIHPEWVAMCGRVSVPMPGETTDHARMTAGLAKAEFVTANAFVRHWALVKVNGFDERFARAWREDSDLQFRLMAEVGHVGRSARAEVLHPVRSAPWGLSLSQQRNTFYDALLYKKHPRLYRERIRRVPPWNYYLIVGLAFAALLLLFAQQVEWAAGCMVLMLALVLHLAYERLRDTSHSLPHVLEMLATSALIPFLSVYWRVRGAIHFRVLFL